MFTVTSARKSYLVFLQDQSRNVILGSEPVIIFSNFLDGSILLKGDVDLNIEQFNKTECEQ